MQPEYETTICVQFYDFLCIRMCCLFTVSKRERANGNRTSSIITIRRFCCLLNLFT